MEAMKTFLTKAIPATIIAITQNAAIGQVSVVQISSVKCVGTLMATSIIAVINNSRIDKLSIYIWHFEFAFRSVFPLL